MKDKKRSAEARRKAQQLRKARKQKNARLQLSFAVLKNEEGKQNGN